MLKYIILLITKKQVKKLKKSKKNIPKKSQKFSLLEPVYLG